MLARIRRLEDDSEQLLLYKFDDANNNNAIAFSSEQLDYHY